ncbi:MerR family transcriptional regulator [Streptomyces eurythermus]
MARSLPSVPADVAAIATGVKPATIRDWRRRGLLTPVGGTPRRPLYALEDVYAAQQAPKTSRANQRAKAAA